jgi:hypothetical protein
MEWSTFFVKAAQEDASKIFFCRRFILSVKALAVVGLLVGRVVFSRPHFSVLGRRVGVLVVPRATSFAATSTASLPGIPMWPGVYHTVISSASTVSRVKASVSWNKFIR